jgi:hypothetical protein
MLLLTQPIVFASLTSANHQERILQIARQKLLASHVSPILRITAFLRLSCLALEGSGNYSQLMRSLFDYDPDWWRTCDITPTGELISTDVEVQQRLALVLRLHSARG